MQPRLNGFAILDENRTLPYLQISHPAQRSYLFNNNHNSRHVAAVADFLSENGLRTFVGGNELENRLFPTKELQNVDLLAIGNQEQMQKVLPLLAGGAEGLRAMIKRYRDNSTTNLSVVPVQNHLGSSIPSIMESSYLLTVRGDMFYKGSPINLRIVSESAVNMFVKDSTRKQLVFLAENGPSPLIPIAYATQRSYFGFDNNITQGVFSALLDNDKNASVYLGGATIENEIYAQEQPSEGIEILVVSPDINPLNERMIHSTIDPKLRRRDQVYFDPGRRMDIIRVREQGITGTDAFPRYLMTYSNESNCAFDITLMPEEKFKNLIREGLPLQAKDDQQR